MDPIEPQLIWLCMFLLCYTTSVDDTNTPHLIGFFAALSCAMATQVRAPGAAARLLPHPRTPARLAALAVPRPRGGGRALRVAQARVDLR